MASRSTSLILIPLAAGVILAFWFVPIRRAVDFYIEAASTYEQQSSIDALDDLIFSRWIIAAYALSLITGLLIAVTAAISRDWLMTLPCLASVLCALYLIRLAPEQGIVIFPTLNPLILIAFSFFLAVGSAGLFLIRQIMNPCFPAGSE